MRESVIDSNRLWIAPTLMDVTLNARSVNEASIDADFTLLIRTDIAYAIPSSALKYDRHPTKSGRAYVSSKTPPWMSPKTIRTIATSPNRLFITSQAIR